MMDHAGTKLMFIFCSVLFRAEHSVTTVSITGGGGGCQRYGDVVVLDYITRKTNRTLYFIKT